MGVSTLDPYHRSEFTLSDSVDEGDQVMGSKSHNARSAV